MSTIRTTRCPNSDHDGSRVPVTRHIDAEHPVKLTNGSPVRVEAARCDYCAEGYIASLIREGWRVTVWAVPAAFTLDEVSA